MARDCPKKQSLNSVQATKEGEEEEAPRMGAVFLLNAIARQPDPTKRVDVRGRTNPWKIGPDTGAAHSLIADRIGRRLNWDSCCGKIRAGPKHNPFRD